MRAEELRIGDWVKLKTDDGTFIKVEVSQLLQESFWGFIDGDKALDEISYDDVEPIQLDADLLYENGFTPTLEDDRIYEYCYGGHYVVNVQEDGEFINLADKTCSRDDEDFDCDLIAMISATCGDRLAVHNLQHFLTENYISIKIEV